MAPSREDAARSPNTHCQVRALKRCRAMARLIRKARKIHKRPSSASVPAVVNSVTERFRSNVFPISTGSFTYITDIKNRRVVIADEQTGLVVGFTMFWHKSDVKTVKIKGVPGIDEMPSYQGTFNLPAMHIYKVKAGKIYDIEAIGFTLPYGTRGWE